MPAFKHSGKLGDVVYALPTIRALGGGELLITTGQPFHFEDSLYGGPLPILRRLLEAQPYISAVAPWEGQNVDYDLDCFRNFFATQVLVETINLCDMHLMSFGLPSTERDTVWLDVPPAGLPEGRDVILCRSSRYRSPFFRWQRVYDEYAHRAVFCGLPVEHEEFEAQVGPVLYRPTADLYELAGLIRSCSLFISNQSAPYALAEGLKVATLQETSLDQPNCIFLREGATYRTVY